MKFTVQIDIALPRDRVVELFDSADNLFKWQRGLKSFEHISGTPGQPGAKSRLVFKMGKRNFSLIETITKRALPDEFDGTYDAKGVHNIVRNRFIETGPSATRWVSECEFQFRGLMRIMAFLMKKAIPKQNLRFMQDFKAFAEHGTDVNA